jgi:TonB-dependent receptor
MFFKKNRAGAKCGVESEYRAERQFRPADQGITALPRSPIFRTGRFRCGPALLSRWMFYSFLSLILLSWQAMAQEGGVVSGVVVSTWDGTPLNGTVVTVRGTTLAVQTGADGRFELRNVPPGDQTLRFSKSGFAAAVVSDVRVIARQTTTVNGNLRPEFYEMEEFEVTAEEFTQQTEQILFERQKSAGMTEALGSDFLSKVGAGNAAESIAKVSGATIVEGKFAVIRGLNDRYVSTTLNGAIIPSADPYRQSASLDLFPAQVIDRVVVAKTFTPDQPGTYTGGGIDIVTKSFPEKPFLSLSLGGAYNPQANLNNRFLGYEGGGHDWAAMDDGTRALPKELEGQVPPAAPPSTGATNASNYATYQQKLRDAYALDRMTRAFGTTDFAPTRETSPLNHNFSLAGGGSTPVFDGLFGYFAGVSYKHDYSFYENGVSRRYWNGDEIKSSYRDARSIDQVNWSGMVNLGYRPFENHQFGFTFFYNQNSVDDSRIQDQGFEQSDEASVFRKFNLYWTERNLNTYQMKGNHVFPDVGDVQFDWLVALTQTTQDEPDARFFNDRDAGNGFETGGNFIPSPSNPTRYFRNLEENNRNVKLDWTVPFSNWTADEGKVKFGVFDSFSKRTFTDRAFGYQGGGDYGSDPNTYLTDENLGIGSTRTNRNGNVIFTWDRYIQVFDSSYEGELGVQAAYGMLELPLVDRLRLVGGVRVEATDLNVHSESYLPSSQTGLRTNDSSIVQTDLLPAVGLIYGVTSNMNIRLNYSQTVARPTFRELAAYRSWDPIISDFVEGNPDLKMTSIQNYDLRWEWFPRPGNLVSVSLFYKEMKDAVERGNVDVQGDVITFFNRDKAKLYGIEFEARQNLGTLSESLSPFSLGGNVSLVESEVKLTEKEIENKDDFFPDLKTARPLYDQSPYIINFDATWESRRLGTTASVIYNIAGPRISVTKLNADDVYEQPAPSLDFILSQKIGRHATMKIAVRNLLDPDIERTYGSGGKQIYSSYRKGRTYGLSLNYDF